MICNAAPASTIVLPANDAFSVSMAGAGSAERLARVSCLTFPSSRKERRSSTERYSTSTPDLFVRRDIFTATCIAGVTFVISTEYAPQRLK